MVYWIIKLKHNYHIFILLKMWELKSWVDPSKLCGFYLSDNKNAIDYLTINPYLIDWKNISKNESAIDLILQNKDKIDWHYLSLNKSAGYILAKNMFCISWQNAVMNSSLIDMILHYDKHKYNYKSELYYMYNFNKNPHKRAIQYFLDNPEKIIWDSMSENTSVIQICEQFGYSKLNWTSISKNPDFIHILLKYPEHIYWPLFSLNTSSVAIKYLRKHKHLIDWVFLSMNPAAEELILENLDKVCWATLSKNPIIFEFNTYKCSTVQRTQIYKEELIAVAMHPDRIKKYLDAGYSLYDII